MGLLADAAELVAEVARARKAPDVKRATVIKNLKALRRQAVLLRWALTRRSTICSLQSTSDRLMPPLLDAGETDIAPHLQALAKRTKKALQCIPSHQGGAEGFRNALALTAKQFAAIAIVEIYKQVHGRAPGIRDEAAHSACGMLHEAATGERAEGSGWERHIRHARPGLKRGIEGDQEHTAYASEVLGARLLLKPILDRHFKGQYSRKRGE